MARKNVCTISGWMLTLIAAGSFAGTVSAPRPSRQLRAPDELGCGVTVTTQAPHIPVQLLLLMPRLITDNPPRQGAAPHHAAMDQDGPRESAPHNTPHPTGATNKRGARGV